MTPLFERMTHRQKAFTALGALTAVLAGLALYPSSGPTPPAAKPIKHPDTLRYFQKKEDCEDAIQQRRFGLNNDNQCIAVRVKQAKGPPDGKVSGFSYFNEFIAYTPVRSCLPGETSHVQQSLYVNRNSRYIYGVDVRQAALASVADAMAGAPELRNFVRRTVDVVGHKRGGISDTTKNLHEFLPKISADWCAEMPPPDERLNIAKAKQAAEVVMPLAAKKKIMDKLPAHNALDREFNAAVEASSDEYYGDYSGPGPSSSYDYDERRDDGDGSEKNRRRFHDEQKEDRYQEPDKRRRWDNREHPSDRGQTHDSHDEPVIVDRRNGWKKRFNRFYEAETSWKRPEGDGNNNFRRGYNHNRFTPKIRERGSARVFKDAHRGDGGDSGRMHRRGDGKKNFDRGSR